MRDGGWMGGAVASRLPWITGYRRDERLSARARRLRRRGRGLLLTGATFLWGFCGHGRAGADTAVWSGGTGDWNDWTAWGAHAPVYGDDACVDGGNPASSVVSAYSAPSYALGLHSLTVDAGDALNVWSSQSKFSFQTATINGSMSVYDTVIVGSAISGAGQISLGYNGNGGFGSLLSYGALTLGSSLTVRGGSTVVYNGGSCGVPLAINYGTVCADTGVLAFQGTNRGTLQASGGGIAQANGLVNFGTVRGGPGGQVLLSGAWTNAGTLLIDGGVVTLRGGTAAAAVPPSVIGNVARTAAGGSLQLGFAIDNANNVFDLASACAGEATLTMNGSIRGGTVSLLGGAVLGVTNTAEFALPAPSIDGVTLRGGAGAGAMQVSGTVNVANRLTLDHATVKVFSSGSVSFGTLSTGIDGDGEFDLEGGGLSCPGSNNVIGSGILIHGKNGSVGGSSGGVFGGSSATLNQGTIRCDVSGGTIAVSGGMMNAGTIEALAGTRVALLSSSLGTGSFTNQGSIAVRSGGSLSLGWDYTYPTGLYAASLATPALANGAGGAGPAGAEPSSTVINVGGNPLKPVSVTNGASILLESGATMYVASGSKLYNSGTFSSSGSARVTVDGTLLSTTPLLLGGATLSGTGTVACDVSLAGGTLSPGTTDGPAPSAIGTLSVVGNVALGGGAHLAIDLTAGGSHDLLAITGNLDLSSTDDWLDLPPNMPLGQPYLVATYTGTRSGIFDHVTAGYDVSYATPGQIVVTSTVPEPAALGLIAGLSAALLRRVRAKRHRPCGPTDCGADGAGSCFEMSKARRPC